MAPVKFDDIPKVAADVLNEDYQVKGYVLKTKQKTSFGDAVLSGQVDMFADDACSTPAKLTWKLPAPFGVKQVDVDKLELDKAGKFKLEASSTKVYPGLKVECKSDLADVDKVSLGYTYTGLKDLQLKLEHKLTKPQDFTGEVTYACPAATCGMKFSSTILSGGLPDFGMRLAHGPAFGALVAKDKLSTFVVHGAYQATPKVKCAMTYQHGGKGGGNFTVGAVCMGLYKMKLSQDQSVSCSVKHSVAKGLTLLAGGRYSLAKGDLSVGAQLSIE